MDYPYEQIVEPLLDWYDYNHRILPWRDDPKPYYVWISEIMLQQTRVEAVKAYFERFIKELPTVTDLAYVDDEKLMKLWEGLGYYNRARNLKKSAIKMVEEYNGQVPGTLNELLDLPGIGPYTGGAIGSIAFGIKAPAVDGNVLRVTKRLAASFDDITKESVKRQLEQDLCKTMSEKRPGDFNQALMELGATICIPNGKPLCDKCPLMHLCKAFKQGVQMSIPVKPPKKPRKVENKTVLLFKCGEKIAIRKREDKGLLAGLWEFPWLEELYSLNKTEEYLENNEIYIKKINRLKSYSHLFSHIEWKMKAYAVEVESYDALDKLSTGIIWVTMKEMEENYSLPTAFSTFL